MRVCLATTVVAISGVMLASCAHVPKPSQEELYARDRWAAMVTEKDRQTVFDETAVHTGWSEKRKVLYQLDQFQKIYRTEDRAVRKAATRAAATSRAAATRAATQRAARLASRPAHHHRTTSGAATEPDSEE